MYLVGFTVRVIPYQFTKVLHIHDWNNLPIDTIESQSLEVFLDKCSYNLILIAIFCNLPDL